jgi:myo-inositol-hexaphosphate 3-phosphohydrolase
MGVVTIDSVKTTDTFETQRTQLNLGLTKLNTIDDDIDVTSEVLTISDSATEPDDPSAGSFVLYMDQGSGDIFIKVLKSDGSVRKYRLVDYDTASNDVTYVAS